MIATTIDVPSGAPVVVLTGAGVSRESGLPTYRDADGLWRSPRYAALAGPGPAPDPDALRGHLDEMRRLLSSGAIAPNAAHIALARLQHEWPGSVQVVTQNVDDLHERAGSTGVIHVHGELLKARCRACGERIDWRADLPDGLACPLCGAPDGLRSDVIGFGEPTPLYFEMFEAVRSCRVLLVVGTSGVVAPAPALAKGVRERGGVVVEVNPAPTIVSDHADVVVRLPAGAGVPILVEGMLAGCVSPVPPPPAPAGRARGGERMPRRTTP